MSMPVYTGGSERYPCDDDILAAAPENPVRFLADTEFAWQAMIDGIDSLERLEAYRQAEKRHIERKNPSEKVDVHEYIDARERELTGSVSQPTTPEIDAPTADAETTSQVAATDGGQELTYDETDDTSEPTREPEGADVHPDVRGLGAGEVLVLERGDAREFIFPATAGADDPYLARTFDKQGNERTPEPITLSLGEVASRIDGSHDPVPIEEIDADAPRGAATNGGSQA